MSRMFRGGIFFPSAYVLLAVGFLTIHYTREKHFNVLIDGIEVREKTSIGSLLAPSKIRKLIVAAAGLELSFSKLNAAVLTTEDGIRHRLAVDGWKEGDDFVEIFLSDDTGIGISSSGQDGTFSLSTVVPPTTPPVKSFEIPLRPASETNAPIHRNNTLAVETNNVEYVLILPPNSRWNRRLQRLIVNFQVDPVIGLTGIQGKSE